MPNLLEVGPYRFYIFSGDCAERRHVHVDRGEKSAKFWLDPDVSLAHNYGYERSELRRLERIIRENLEKLKDGRDTFCRGDAHHTEGTVGIGR